MEYKVKPHEPSRVAKHCEDITEDGVTSTLVKGMGFALNLKDRLKFKL